MRGVRGWSVSPSLFFARDLEPALDDAREGLGRFLGADPDDLAFVTNATTGVNIVARSLRLDPGDEIVLLDHAYPAARNALQATADARRRPAGDRAPPRSGRHARSGARRCPRGRRPANPARDGGPRHEPDGARAAGAEIVAALDDRGIDTLVDGAHAPGMVDLDLDAIGAAYTVGNCHKWMCAPKGSAFLHVRRDRQELVRPIVISHGASSTRTDRSRFRLEHDWTGTLDPTPWLSVPAAIAFGDGLVPGGWPALRERGHRLALAARDLLAEAVGEPSAAPDEMVGAMVSVPLPPTTEPRRGGHGRRSRARRPAPSRNPGRDLAVATAAGRAPVAAPRPRQLRAVRRARRHRGARRPPFRPLSWPPDRCRSTPPTLDRDPIRQLEAWLAEATDAGVGAAECFRPGDRRRRRDAIGSLRPAPRPRRRRACASTRTARAGRGGTWPSTPGLLRPSGGRRSTARRA